MIFMLFMYSKLCSRHSLALRPRDYRRRWFLFRLKVLVWNVGVIDQVEKADHSFVPALLAPDYSLRGIRIFRIVR